MEKRRRNKGLKDQGIVNETKGEIIGLVIQKNQVIRSKGVYVKRRRVERKE